MREMKDSGIPWVGQIPDDWIIKRGKFTLKLLSRPVLDTDEVITCFRDGEVTLRRNRREDGFTISLKEIGYQGLEPGDLVIHGMDGFAGSIGISDSRGKASPVLVVCDSDENKRYIMYYLRAMAYNDVFAALATGIRVRSCDLRWNKLSELPYILPSIQEQEQVVEVIESCTQNVNSLIANVQTQIEKLKAYKQSVITEAVTKGLDPDVPMKDSGVENVGEIPRHWEMTRLKYLLSHIIDCPHETPSYSSDGNYYVIRTADQDVAKLRSDEDMYRLDEGEYQNRIRRQSLDKDDIVYGREGERWGLACLVPESNKYCLGQRMMQFRCHNLLFLPQYAVYALSSQYVYQQGFSDTMGSTSPHVNISSIRNFYIPIPPLNEQFELARYLREKCSQIDQLISIKQSKIEKLEQYKRSLIYEYVTGKRDVM